MKKYVSLLLIVLLATTGYSQKKFLILGQVLDSANDQPLNGASVFAQNTTFGTTTDTSGIFRMSLADGGYDLVISYTGYEKKTVRVSNSAGISDTLFFSLKPLNTSLEEVAVVASNEVADGWEKYGKFFFDHFVGTTPNANACSILNPQALRFYYTKNKKRHTLRVKATDDILILNNALGYFIRYQLDSFSYDYNSRISQYTGYPFFIDRDTTEELRSQWIKNRARTFLGSRLHFMTSLYDSATNHEGFIVEKLEGNGKNAKGTVIDNLYDSTIYAADSNVVYIGWSGRYRVTYKSVWPEQSFLKEYQLPLDTRTQVTILDVNDGFVIEQNGFFYEQYDVINTGYWAWKKLAEQLPYDYQYE